jgi:hypothetical protein
VDERGVLATHMREQEEREGAWALGDAGKQGGDSGRVGHRLRVLLAFIWFSIP